jgi:hypothetical protein
MVKGATAVSPALPSLRTFARILVFVRKNYLKEEQARRGDAGSVDEKWRCAYRLGPLQMTCHIVGYDLAADRSNDLLTRVL